MSLEHDILKSQYGEPLLCYLYGTKDSVSEQDIASNRAVTDQLFSLVGELVSNSSEYWRSSVLNSLTTWDESSKMSIANQIRVSGGNRLPILPKKSDDEILDNLIKLALDVWPAYLIPRPQGATSLIEFSPHGVFSHPAAQQLYKQILLDESLQKLFPQANIKDLEGSDLTAAINVRSFYWDSRGSGSSLSLTMVVNHLLLDAYTNLLISQSSQSFPLFISEIRAALDRLRGLARGEEVQIATVVGVAGLLMGDEDPIDFLGSELRSVKASDSVFLGAVQPDSILIQSVDIKIVKIYESMETGFKPPEAELKAKFAQQTEAQERDIDLMRLSLLLASKSKMPVAMVELSRFIAGPLGSHRTMTWRRGISFGGTQVIKKTLLKDATVWLRKLKKLHTPQLDIAMRRALSASGERVDPRDAFVDAVVGWESLVGTSQETTYRVTASIAKLLYPDNRTAREKAFSDFKKIYGKRSRLLHGSTEIKFDEATELRDTGLSVLLDVLRKLYTTRADLLPVSSEQRSHELLTESISSSPSKTS